MFLSVLDVFEIGIGLSSLHAMGPMSAANRFMTTILSNGRPRPTVARVAALKVSLHGSLAFSAGRRTGKGVTLRLMGEEPRARGSGPHGGIIALRLRSAGIATKVKRVLNDPHRLNRFRLGSLPDLKRIAHLVSGSRASEPWPGVGSERC